MSEATDAFLRWAEEDRLRSEHTLTRYRAVFATLAPFAGDPAAATMDEIQAWWNSRLGKSPATRQNELACLRAFYKYAIRFDYCLKDPTRRLDAPKVDNALPRPIPRADLLRVLEACDERDLPEIRRAIALGAYAGLRVSEAAALDWSQVDEEKRVLIFRGKGRKERVCAASPKLFDEILPRPEQGGNVVRAGGIPYSADTLQRRINRLFDNLGIDATFHKLRARYVTQGIAETGDIFHVAKAVGWSSIETAKHYAEVNEDVLQRIAAAAAR